MKTIINNNKYFIYFRKQLYKLVVVLVVVSVFFNVLNIQELTAYYNDTESSSGNSFIAGLVDFLLETSDWQPLNTAVSMTPGDTTKKTVRVNPQNSNPFQYYVKKTNVTGDSDFCNGLNVVAKLEGVEMYHGPITGLLTTATIAKNTPNPFDSWEFTYTTTTDFQNKICDFDIDYNGWQTRHNFPTYENGGYSDTEKVKNHLASWGFRINKVYYDVASDRGAEGANEWVEIYNQTNTALDISGWKICDNNSCDTLPTTPLIPALKYAIIVADSTTVSNLLPAYWYLPSEVTQINIGSEIGSGLNNDADMLTLKRPDGVIVDQMNWGTPDTGWAKYNTNVWNPGAVDVAEGNVLARIPSGYDTDQASDWKELKPPSVDLTYPDEGGSYTWYWDSSYTITWVATNNNGADSDLNIRIFYIKDVNHDGIISIGDTTFTIAETTANDGSFDWTVPSGFLGYIWIYLVATGPENPMLNSGTVSGRIYDPIPIFIGPEGIVAPELPIEEIVEPMESVELEESPLSATLPEEIPQASPEEEIAEIEELEEIIETEDNVVPEVITEIPPVTEPEEVITEETEIVETSISEIIEPAFVEDSGVAIEEAVVEEDVVIEEEVVEVVETPIVEEEVEEVSVVESVIVNE